MPRVREEDRQFRARLGNVLLELRHAAEWTQEQAAEEIGTTVGTLGRWERGDHAPKGYDLGRLFRAYERVGARYEWFFDPPEVLVTNPVRDRLDALRRERLAEAEALGREGQQEAEAARQASAAQRAARRRTRSA